MDTACLPVVTVDVADVILTTIACCVLCYIVTTFIQTFKYLKSDFLYCETVKLSINLLTFTFGYINNFMNNIEILVSFTHMKVQKRPIR